MSAPLLEVDDLWVRFSAAQPPVYAVRGVSYRIEPGESLAIVGESGSGKTVSALAVLGLLPEGAQVAGDIRFDGTSLVGASERTLSSIRGAQIGLVSQDPLSSLNPLLTIGTQIEEVLRAHRDISRLDARKKAVDLLGEVGIHHPHERVDQYPHQLSGGMRQRVIIAIAIACEPRLLIADEPTTALDVTVQAQIIELLMRLRRERGMGLLFITHDLGVVAGLADRIAVMYAGEIVEHGSARGILEHPEHPYTRGLLHSVPRLDQPVDVDLEPIPGSPPDLREMAEGCSFAPRCRFAMPECTTTPPALHHVHERHTVACFAVEKGLLV
jgi:oligopeptide/dipeptide ABC transporter ATP-binding protein